jgi:hypothetical protein
MALQGGHRFAVSMAEVFPAGVYALSVVQAEDYDEKTARRSASKDKVSGQLVWTVTALDRDPEARTKEVKIKVTGPVMPVLPGEILPGSGLHTVDFTGLTITPYLVEGAVGRRPRIAYSYRATGVWPQGKAPTSSGHTRASGPAAQAATSGDVKQAEGKAA